MNREPYSSNKQKRKFESKKQTDNIKHYQKITNKYLEWIFYTLLIIAGGIIGLFVRLLFF